MKNSCFLIFFLLFLFSNSNIVYSKKSVYQRKNYDKYVHDNAGNLIKVISKDKGIIKKTYDEYSRLKSINKSDLEFVKYYYDLLGRKTIVEFKNKKKTDSVKFKYSTPENSYKLGNLIEKIEKFEHSYYEYTDSNRISEEKKVINGRDFQVKYKYNKENLLSEIHYPSGLIIKYLYDEMNNINKVISYINKKETILYTNIIKKNSRNFKYGNGLETKIEYNNEKKSISMKTGNIRDMVFLYNKKDQLYKVKNRLNPRYSKEFFFDTHNRLMTAFGSWGVIKYRFDKIDNLKLKMENKSNLKIDYYHNSSKIEKIDLDGKKINCSFDKLGRMKNYKDLLFNYNERGLLEEIKKKDRTKISLQYNNKNERIFEKNGDKEYYYIYNNKGNLLSIYDKRENNYMEFFYLRNRPIGFIKNNKIFYYHYDIMKYPVIISNQKGEKIQEVDYKPFGEIIYKKNKNFKNILGYPGQLKIEGTSLFYNLNRVYFPSLSRYLEPDKFHSNYENNYQYAVGNPIKFNDSMGLYSNTPKKWEYRSPGKKESIELTIFPTTEGLGFKMVVQCISNPYCKGVEAEELFINFSVQTKLPWIDRLLKKIPYVKWGYHAWIEIKTFKTSWKINKWQQKKPKYCPSGTDFVGDYLIKIDFLHGGYLTGNIGDVDLTDTELVGALPPAVEIKIKKMEEKFQILKFSGNLKYRTWYQKKNISEQKRDLHSGCDLIGGQK